ncbi:MAG: VWA domain-containing protein [Nitriliruptorales bacterium]|nr:VWA domain-containing protein [Nitriliruptorales bacterium]
MMPLRALLVVAAAAAIAALPAGAAAKEKLDIIDTHVDDRGGVTVTVAAPAGLAETDLTEQFAVAEDGVTQVAQAQLVAGGSREVILVIDTSGSMNGRAMAAAKSAAVSFIRQLPDGVGLGVVGFGDRPRVASRFREAPAAAINAVRSLEARGETAMYDAVIRATEQFSSSPDVSRTVVLLSDGADTVSDASLSSAKSALKAADTSFTAIRLKTTDSEVAPLRSLASSAGGILLSANDPGALDAVYAQIAKSMKNEYVLRYASTGHGPAELRLSLPDRPDVSPAVAELQLPKAIPAPRPRATPAPAPPVAPATTPPSPLVVLLQNPWTMRGAAASVFLALSVLFLLLRPRRQRRVNGLSALMPARGRHNHVDHLGEWAKSRVDQALQRRNLTDRINHGLEQAGILLRPAEFVLLVAGISALLMLVGQVWKGPAVGLLLAVLPVLGAKVFLGVKAERRKRAFGAQLADTLQMMAGSLRSGYGLLQAADGVAKEAASPTADEFRRLVMETRLGRDIEETLRAMADRVGGDDFTWVMQAIEIHREVGGDLSVVLDQVGGTIREREQVFRQVKSLSAEGRMSAIILLALPFIVVGGVTLMNPAYMNEMFTTGIGRMLIGLCFALMTVGTFWVRKVVKPKF